jgi:hypothetical protein
MRKIGRSERIRNVKHIRNNATIARAMALPEDSPLDPTSQSPIGSINRNRLPQHTKPTKKPHRARGITWDTSIEARVQQGYYSEESCAAKDSISQHWEGHDSSIT